MLIQSKNLMVPPARLELALPKKPDFESGASTNSATGACQNESDHTDLDKICKNLVKDFVHAALSPRQHA